MGNVFDFLDELEHYINAMCIEGIEHKDNYEHIDSTEDSDDRQYLENNNE